MNKANKVNNLFTATRSEISGWMMRSDSSADAVAVLNHLHELVDALFMIIPRYMDARVYAYKNTYVPGMFTQVWTNRRTNLPVITFKIGVNDQVKKREEDGYIDDELEFHEDFADVVRGADDAIYRLVNEAQVRLLDAKAGDTSRHDVLACDDASIICRHMQVLYRNDVALSIERHLHAAHSGLWYLMLNRLQSKLPFWRAADFTDEEIFRARNSLYYDLVVAAKSPLEYQPLDWRKLVV